VLNVCEFFLKPGVVRFKEKLLAHLHVYTNSDVVVEVGGMANAPLPKKLHCQKISFLLENCF